MQKQKRKEVVRKGNLELPNTKLCEKLLSTENIMKAVKKVEKNRGSAGIDGMTVKELRPYVMENINEIRRRILARKYNPKAVRRVEIPKDNGKVRLLGIPTVLDRMIQQAIVQVITPLFEPTFSDFSYGYRPGKSAEDAVRQAQIYMAEGYKFVVDMDLSKFFDTVNHDKLMGYIDETLEDKDIRRLIFVFIKAGVMVDGIKVETTKGTPQGGVISPLLSNIYLTPFDKEMEKRGIKFIRYADDIQLFAKSKMSSYRLKDHTIDFLERKMKLTVNREKTEARKAEGSKILGFVFLTTGKKQQDGSLKLGYLIPRDKSVEKLKMRVREITKRNRGVSISLVIGQLNSLLRGWLNYYARSNMKVKIRSLVGWIKRRLRQYIYKQWKTSKNRKHQLRLLGTDEWKLKKMHLSTNRYWKMSIIMGRFLTDKVLIERFGLVDSQKLYEVKHEEKRDKDIEIFMSKDYEKQMVEKEEGSLLLEEDYNYFNFERFIG